MRTEHNKLVRDRIPEIIRNSGTQCGVRTVASREEAIRLLLDKTQEETSELREIVTKVDCATDPVIEKFADLVTVIDALQYMLAIDSDELGEVVAKRRREKGWYATMQVLEWTDDGKEEA